MTLLASDTALKDSGERKNFDTGAHRDNSSGKGRFDLLPVDALFEVAKHFEKGAIKYAARNWEKGIPISRYIDSALRHTLQYLRGDRDEPHLIAGAWNLLAGIQTLAWIEQGILPPDLNDLPVRDPVFTCNECGESMHKCICYTDLVPGSETPDLRPAQSEAEAAAWHGNPEANENIKIEDRDFPIRIPAGFYDDDQDAANVAAGPVVDDRDAPQACAADGLCKCCTLMDGGDAAEETKRILQEKIAEKKYEQKAHALGLLAEPEGEEVENATAFVIFNPTSNEGPSSNMIYWWDGVGRVWFNPQPNQIGNIDYSPTDASGYFGQAWHPVREHPPILIQAFRQGPNHVSLNDALSRVEFWIENNRRVGYFVYNDGSRQANPHPIHAYEFDDDWIKAV